MDLILFISYSAILTFSMTLVAHTHTQAKPPHSFIDTPTMITFVELESFSSISADRSFPSFLSYRS